VNFLTKLLFTSKKPKVIVVDDSRIAEIIRQLLNGNFKVCKLEESALKFSNVLKEDIFILNTKNEGFNFVFQNSRQKILVINDLQQDKNIANLIKKLPQKGYVALNFDETSIRNLRKDFDFNSLSFGFYDGSDVRATDVASDAESTKFKLNYKGGFTPIWLKPLNLDEKTAIYCNLAAIATAIISGLNLVEISQKLKQQ